MKLLLLISLLSVFTLLSCNDATTNPEAKYPILPFKTDVIRPLSVGNYWVYDFIVKDSVVSRVHLNVVDSTNKTYEGKNVSVFTIKTENKEMETPPSFSDVFVLNNSTYHTKKQQKR